jgi:hypothetical protein
MNTLPDAIIDCEECSTCCSTRAFSCVDLVLRITQYTEEQRERVKEIIDSEVYAEGKRRLL